MAVQFTDPDEDDSSVSAPPYSPLTESSICSEVLCDDLDYDSEEEEAFNSALEEEEAFNSAEVQGDQIGKFRFTENFVK